MSTVLSILHIAAPLLLLTLGGLISEYSGRMALFLDGAINLGAFLCYGFTVLTHSLPLGMFLSVICVSLLTLALERTASRFKANMFLAGLAMNILYSALAIFLSATFFKTRGVLYGELFSFNARTMRFATTLICIAISFMTILMLRFTVPGISLRICGSDSQVLDNHGLSSRKYKSIAWIFAASFAALTGCVLCSRLSSYVPGMASGRGWTALAAVFLGRKHPLIVAVAVLVFAVAEYLSSYIQNISLFANIPSSILLSLPYLISLLLIMIVPNKQEIK